MIAGRRAFQADNVVETLSAILKHDPPVLTGTIGEIPPALASVTQRCLEKDRAERFQSARDLAFALSHLVWTSASGALPAVVDRPGGLGRWPIAAGVTAALLLALGAASYLGRPPDGTQPVFKPLTFRRGHVSVARFAPDGQTVISSASWDGKPSQVSSTRLDTAEPAALPLGNARLVSISRSGELALLKDPDGKSVLARVPIGAAGTRDLAEHVIDADWAPDGSLAAIRAEGRHLWLEFPIGTTIYDPGNAVNSVRVSPDGSLLAVMEQQQAGGGPEWLTILDRKGAVVSRSQRWACNFIDGVAWTPDAREVWYAASEIVGHTAIQGLSRDGRQRTVHTGMGSIRVLDVAPDGRALLSSDSTRADIILVDINAASEQDLTYREWSRPTALSDDGRLVAFGSGGRTDKEGKTPAFIRWTDGFPDPMSPEVQLTDNGNIQAISPDNKWVVVAGLATTERTISPTGSGQARRLDNGTVVEFNGMMNGTRWLPDGQQIVFVGREAGKPRRVFLQSVSGGPPKPITPEREFGPMAVSPDSNLVAVGANNSDQRFVVYPLAGGSPTPVAGSEKGDQPLAWGRDGSIWVLDSRTRPARIFRIDSKTGRRGLWREVPYADPAFTEGDSLRVVMSADGTKFVYGYQKHLSELYVATGLR